MTEVIHNSDEECLTDEELVIIWRKDNDAALETLLRRYERRIYSFLLRMLRSQHDAEDAAQDCFVRAVRALDRFSTERGKFKSWLFQIAYREGLRTAERRKRLPVREDAWEMHEHPAPEAVDQAPLPGEAIINNEQTQQMQKAIECLPEAQKQVVLLRVYSELRFREIAEITNTPLNTVLSLMHKASLRLKALLPEMRKET